eukprot:snap_masked-scaffold_59-processed-gene-0.89-mRNA-1 protein AED:1.00 eAED:1.00 QI:0/-1/0/0/-1/1/1/0/109
MNFSRVEYDLDGKLVEVGWNIYQALLLKNLVMHFRFANYKMILKYMPQHNHQQTYNKLQSWINMQAIGDYTYIRLNLGVVGKKNNKWLGEEYRIERRISNTVELDLQKW